MIRKQVENLRGLILTKEEIKDIIIPVLITTKEYMEKYEKVENESLNDKSLNIKEKIIE